MQKHYLLISLALIAVLFIGAFTFYSNAAGIMGASITPPNLQNGLVGHWTFDGGDMVSKVKDSSGQGNDGHLVGFTSTTTVPGILGQGLAFAGGSQEIDVGNKASLSLTSAITMSVWMYADACSTLNCFSDSGYILGKVKSTWTYEMAVTPSSQAISMKINTTECAYGGAVNQLAPFRGRWDLVTGVYDGSNEILYINGQQYAKCALTGAITTSTDGFAIGDRGVGGGSSFTGVLDDVRIYNRAFSADEVGQLYNVGIGSHQNAPTVQLTLQNGLVGHWTFDGGDMVSNVTDSSGQGNNGKLGGFTSTTTVSGVLGQALSFSGGTQNVNVGSPASLTNIFAAGGTVSFWVKTSANHNGENALSKAVSSTASSGWVLNMGWSPSLQRYGLNFYRAFSGNTPGWAFGYPNANIVPNQWAMVTLTYNDSSTSNNPSMYINGTPVTVNAPSPVPSGTASSDSGHALIIGNAPVLNLPMFGSMDDVRVYNRILSASEIQALYQQSVGTHQNVSITPPNLDTGLIGHYTFDGPDMISNVKDSSGNGNNGHLINFISTTTTAGVLGQAIKFDGTSDYVKMGAGELDLSGTNYVTVTAWVRADKSIPDPPVNVVRWDSGSTNPYAIEIKTTGSFGLSCVFHNASGHMVVDNFTNIVGTFSVGKWYFLACTYDGTGATGKAYVNGVLTNTITGTSGVITKTGFGNQALLIGAGGSTSDHFPGSVDDVRVYNRTLSASEIQQLYNLGRSY